MKEKQEVIAIIGGTGNLLALRWAREGYEVIVGSRIQEKAQTVVDDMTTILLDR